MKGPFALLEPLDPKRHAADLFVAFENNDEVWDYLPYGPFSSSDAFETWLHQFAAGEDPLFFAVEDRERRTVGGVASWLRIKPESGSIEVGHLNFSPSLQKTRAATEAMYLMMRWVFTAGYRRYEWKCNALNLASRRAAQRLGFSYEGVFRQAAVVKGRNRDTAWFAMIDSEWPAVDQAFRTWLAPSNFDAQGRQMVRLSELTAPLLFNRDPALRARN